MWLARDKDGFFMLFGDKPIRENDHWVEKWLNDDFVRLGYLLEGFDKMTFDDEPVEVDLIIKQHNYGNEDSKEKLSIDDFPGLKAVKEELLAKGWREVEL